MPSQELLNIVEATICSIHPETCMSRQIYLAKNTQRLILVQKLATFFPDTLVLAALDLIDRDRGAF
jgi:hypothetical protein